MRRLTLRRFTNAIFDVFSFQQQMLLYVATPVPRLSDVLRRQQTGPQVFWYS
jgi:hypothetical protein